MTDLLLVLLPIALLDSLSMVPLTVAPLALMLNGAKPITTTTAFLAGIFLAYFSGGVLLMYGLDALFERIEPAVMRFLNAPTTLELLVQFVLGVIMVGFGWKLAGSRESHGPRGADTALSPVNAFLLGATLTLVGLPGALPYFGAIDQILRDGKTELDAMLALAGYNAAFILPHASLMAVRILAPQRSEHIFQVVAQASEKWGRRLIIVILFVVGITLVADTIGWWFGYPLLPIGDPVTAASSSLLPEPGTGAG